jgi:hypothetical protein
LAVFVVHSRRDLILALDPLRMSVIIREPEDRGRSFAPRRRQLRQSWMGGSA